MFLALLPSAKRDKERDEQYPKSLTPAVEVLTVRRKARYEDVLVLVHEPEVAKETLAVDLEPIDLLLHQRMHLIIVCKHRLHLRRKRSLHLRRNEVVALAALAALVRVVPHRSNWCTFGDPPLRFWRGPIEVSASIEVGDFGDFGVFRRYMRIECISNIEYKSHPCHRW